MHSRTNSEARLLKRSAPNDLASSLAYAIGFRDKAYRQMAVDALQLRKGDQVVEIGCGTGRNFAMLEHAVGSDGVIIAVDLSETMLARARKRVARHGWSNIELVHSDAAAYAFPASVGGVLFTYSLVIIPEYDKVVENACQALNDGKRCAVLEQKLPSGPAAQLTPLLNLLSRPLNYSSLVGKCRPWESMRRYADNVRMREFYFGFVYLVVGEKKSAGARM